MSKQWHEDEIKLMRRQHSEVHLIVRPDDRLLSTMDQTADLVDQDAKRAGWGPCTFRVWERAGTAERSILELLAAQELWGGNIRVWLVDGATLDPAVLRGLGLRFVSSAMEVEP